MTTEEASRLADPDEILLNSRWNHFAIVTIAFDKVIQWTPFAQMVGRVGVSAFGELVEPLTRSAIESWRSEAPSNADGDKPRLLAHPIAMKISAEVKSRLESLIEVWAFEDEALDLMLVSFAYHPELSADFEVKRWHNILNHYGLEVVLSLIASKHSLTSIEEFIAEGIDTNILISLDNAI